ncbi:MAG: hypothetical protein GXY17_06835 [Clostridiaceae bacterium]|jgi:hypothetical protein|nr:hypothetical protein [Clostridiaceae bacterium]
MKVAAERLYTDWKGLSEHFARVIEDGGFAYSAYENRAKGLECKAGVMPKIAELIQRDFDAKWFSDGGNNDKEQYRS